MLNLAHNAVNAVGAVVSKAEAVAETVATATIAAPVTVVTGVGSAVLSAGDHLVDDVVDAITDIFTFPDKKILDLIYATHVHKHDDNFDEDSMFVVVESIIKHSYQIVDSIVQGTNVHVEIIDDKQPKDGFISPLCILKSISSELSCKPIGVDIVHKSALAILQKLSEYSWDSKAVLTLAGFALDYGDFWLLAKTLQKPDNFSKSLAILRRVTILLNPLDLQKRQKAIIELNNLIKATFDVVEILFELDKLTSYDSKDVPVLAEVLDHIPVDVYWIISAIIASSTKINILTSEEDKPYNLAPYAQKIHYILNKLKSQLIICKKQIEEVEWYKKLRKLFQTPTEILEIIKALVFPKQTVYHIYDGSTHKTVTIEVLRKKNVFLLFSGPEIHDDLINILLPVFEETKKNNQYVILWIPIVEAWTDELKAKFETVCKKIPWYVVQNFAPIYGIRYITEEWNYKGKPIVVHLNPKGKVEILNVLHLLRVWGIKAFPFSKAIEDEISKQKNWIENIIRNIDTKIPTWIKEEKYIFFYGGKDDDWVQNFAKKVANLVNNSVIKDANVSIEIFQVGKTPQGPDDVDIVGKFWNGIESLFLTTVHKEIDIIRQEIQKLLSCRNEIGWAFLTKGSTVIFISHGTPAIRVVEDVEKWIESVKENGFEISILDYLNNITKTVHYCSRLDIPSTAGKVPEVLECPECPRIMETFVTYKCCHVDGPAR